MSGLTTTGATVIEDLDNTAKSILLMEGNASMAWWYWNNCNCYSYFPDFKNWWNASCFKQNLVQKMKRYYLEQQKLLLQLD